MNMQGIMQTQELYHRAIEDLAFEVSNSADIDICDEVVDLIKKNWRTKLDKAMGKPPSVDPQMHLMQQRYLPNQYPYMQWHQKLLTIINNNQSSNHQSIVQNNNAALNQYTPNNASRAILNQSFKEGLYYNHHQKQPSQFDIVIKPIETKEPVQEKQEPKPAQEKDIQFSFGKQDKVAEQIELPINGFKEEEGVEEQEVKHEEPIEEDEDAMFFQDEMVVHKTRDNPPGTQGVQKKIKIEFKTDNVDSKSQFKTSERAQEQRAVSQQVVVRQTNYPLPPSVAPPEEQNDSDGISLGSKDDIPDQEQLDTKNVIYGYYTKVNRSGSKWKVFLKNLIAKIEDKEILFQDLQGEFQFINES